jgi:hypothetical protein
MNLSMYSTARSSTLRALANLDTILDKAVASAEARKFDPQVFLGARLAPDMFPLTRQVQIACDFCKGTMARLGGVENPRMEDTETSFAELKARIAKTRAFVEGVAESGFAGAEDREIAFQAGPNQMQMQGLPYLLGYALPNLYFHMSMAYAILRHNGVDLGKRDFLGQTQ